MLPGPVLPLLPGPLAVPGLGMLPVPKLKAAKGESVLVPFSPESLETVGTFGLVWAGRPGLPQSLAVTARPGLNAPPAT
eukprot:601839-Rhodomonas_salina.3